MLTVPAPTGTHVVIGGHDPTNREDGYLIGVYADPQPPTALGPWRGFERTGRCGFHPTQPLLVLGTGSYDGRYFFEDAASITVPERADMAWLLELIPEGTRRADVTLRIHDGDGRYNSDSRLTWAGLVDIRAQQNVPGHAVRLAGLGNRG
ncbi:hypothetical protein [Streptomyces abikoensis]|uniref:hypothetical protein n=1 Tax=Streptomyces abikoensis TaxID=97398 RepID=UPI003698BA14